MSQDQTKKSSRIRRGCFGYLGTIIILAIPIWYFCLHTTPLKISKETTYVLGPKTADGERIDYFLAMEERYYPPEMKTDDNGYRLIVRAFGVKTDKDDSDFYRQQVYEKLGLDPDEKPTLKIEDPLEIIAQYAKEHSPEKNADNLWDRFQHAAMWMSEDFPMLKDWLEENNAGLDLLGETVRKPAFHFPFILANNEDPSVAFLLFLEGAPDYMGWTQAVAARAKYRIGTGDIDGAIDDLVTMYYLGRHIGKHGIFITWIIGNSIESSAYQIGITSNPDVQPTKAQIVRLMSAIDALPPRWTWKEVIESERLFGLAYIQDIYWGPTSSGKTPPSLLRFISLPYWLFDVNIAMKRMNENSDALLVDPSFVINQVNNDAERSKKSPWILLSLLSPRNRTNWAIDKMMSLQGRWIPRHYRKWSQYQCAENLHRLTLALLLYEKEHNKLPVGDWREAVKPYFGKNPEQCFRCPACELTEDETTYAMVVGESHSPAAPPFLIVEVAKPQKLGEGNGRVSLETLEELSNIHDGFLVGNRNGAVRFLSKHAKPEEFKELLE